MAAPSDYGRIVDADDVAQSDTNNDQFYNGIRNGDSTAGDIKVRLAGRGTTKGKVHIFRNVPSGDIIRCEIDTIFETDTSVTKVDGLIIE